MAPSAVKRTASSLVDSDGEKIEVLSASPAKKKQASRASQTASSSSSPSSSSSKAIHSFFSKPNKAAADQDRVTWLPSLGPDRSCLLGIFKDALKSTIDQGKTSASSTAQRIAAFDLDGTLIETSSGRAPYNFLDENDFRLWGRTSKERSTVKAKLQKEWEDGSLILILTNQLNLDQKPARLKVWKSRLDLILRQLDVPAVLFASLRKDAYRKPAAGWIDDLREMWTAAGGQKELDITPGELADATDTRRSFFVGDAAGRRAIGGRTKDFGDTDRKLAHNLGWRFYTPEEYFADENPAAFDWSGYRPSQVMSSSSKLKLEDLRRRLLNPATTSPTLLVLVGPQASGKSFFAKRLTSESEGRWVRVNQDTLKNKDRCVRVAETALKEGKSVVVDNTSPAKATRALWTTLAKKHGVKHVVCLHFDLSRNEAQHNDAFRSKRWLFPSGSSTREALPPPMPTMAFNSYFKNLERPEAGEGEGFQEVLHVGFEFDGDGEEEKAWKMWYF